MRKTLNWRAGLRITVLFLPLLGFALLPSAFSVSASTQPHWTVCREHLDWQTMSRVTRSQCWTIPIRHGGTARSYWHRTQYVSPHIRRVVSYPISPAPERPVVQAVVGAPVASRGGYNDTWLVTWYAATGNAMANGQYPYPGAAACGYDVALGTRVFVAGIGTFTCADREGPTGIPWHHIDIFNEPGVGGDHVVTVYP